MMSRGLDRTAGLAPGEPVLIAGPTAAGKSALAMRLAARLDGIVINADALQVYANWRLLTARPTAADEAQAPHALYGHVARETAYSVGAWLADVKNVITKNPTRTPIFVGGTGLYFSSLINGLSDIPEVSDEVRATADRRMRSEGFATLRDELAKGDPDTLARIDAANPVRVQRAWEVWTSTGLGLAHWHAKPRRGLVALRAENAFVLDAPKDWLTPRISTRLAAMVAEGALDECRANLADWDPRRPSSRAIGAAEFIAHLKGDLTLDEALAAAAVATRQYAKRQRTWFRKNMANWTWLQLSTDGWG